MAKTETPKLLTFNKAQKYLADQGLTLSTQQVRNLARKNEHVMAGVSDYTDPVTDSTAKVIDASALDRYITWRASNPESVGRGGRKPAAARPAHIMVDVSQLDALNAVLTANGFNVAEFPVRKPRKSKKADASTNGVGPTFDDSVSSDVDLSELELIDIA
jgi:hypothetical protein